MRTSKKAFIPYPNTTYGSS